MTGHSFVITSFSGDSSKPDKLSQTLKSNSSTITTLTLRDDNLPPKDLSISSLPKHIQWVIDNIYSKPYSKLQFHYKLWPKQNPEKEVIARVCHGGQHISRATLYGLVDINYLRAKGNKAALALTDEDVACCLCAIAWHDSGREGENEDLWDKDSALSFYNYCTQVLGLEHKRVKRFAEAIANKDFLSYREENFEVYIGDSLKRKKNIVPNKTYYSLELDSKNTCYWREIQPNDNGYPKEKDIVASIVHDADCLDIHRARDAFDGNYLDLCFLYKFHENEQTLKEIALLITEARSLGELQGDGRHTLNLSKKEQYEKDKNCYKKTVADIDKSHSYGWATTVTYPVLNRLYNNGKLITAKNPEILLSETCKEKDEFYVRGISLPSAKTVDTVSKTKITEQREYNLCFCWNELPPQPLQEKVYYLCVAPNSKPDQSSNLEYVVHYLEKDYPKNKMVKKTVSITGPDFTSILTKFYTERKIFEDKFVLIDYKTDRPEEKKILEVVKLFTVLKDSETLAELELRKVHRTLGSPTRRGNVDKEGNPNRSCSLICGYGEATFTNMGYIINAPTIVDVLHIDGGTGRRKKENYTPKIMSKELNQELLKLKKANMLGGALTYFEILGDSNKLSSSAHNEVIAKITKIDGIFYNNDYCLFNTHFISGLGVGMPQHRNVPPLEAIYLQGLLRDQYQRKVDIFEYSGVHHSRTKVDFDYSTEEGKKRVLDLWRVIFDDFFNNNAACDFVLKDMPNSSLSESYERILTNPHLSLDELKVLMTYDVRFQTLNGLQKFIAISSINSLDSNYPTELKQKINKLLEEKKSAYLKKVLDIVYQKIDQRLNGINIDENEKKKSLNLVLVSSILISQCDNIQPKQKEQIEKYLLTISKEMDIFDSYSAGYLDIEEKRMAVVVYSIAVKLGLSTLMQEIDKSIANAAKKLKEDLLASNTIDSHGNRMLFLSRNIFYFLATISAFSHKTALPYLDLLDLMVLRACHVAKDGNLSDVMNFIDLFLKQTNNDEKKIYPVIAESIAWVIEQAKSVDIVNGANLLYKTVASIKDLSFLFVKKEGQSQTMGEQFIQYLEAAVRKYLLQLNNFQLGFSEDRLLYFFIDTVKKISNYDREKINELVRTWLIELAKLIKTEERTLVFAEFVKVIRLLTSHDEAGKINYADPEVQASLEEIIGKMKFSFGNSYLGHNQLVELQAILNILSKIQNFSQDILRAFAGKVLNDFAYFVDGSCIIEVIETLYLHPVFESIGFTTEITLFLKTLVERMASNNDPMEIEGFWEEIENKPEIKKLCVQYIKDKEIKEMIDKVLDDNDQNNETKLRIIKSYFATMQKLGIKISEDCFRLVKPISSESINFFMQNNNSVAREKEQVASSKKPVIS
jgi:hypothetical protein